MTVKLTEKERDFLLDYTVRLKETDGYRYNYLAREEDGSFTLFEESPCWDETTSRWDACGLYDDATEFHYIDNEEVQEYDLVFEGFDTVDYVEIDELLK